MYYYPYYGMKSSLQEESFEIILNAKDNIISANELINYLSNFEDLFKSINNTLKLEYSIGAYDVYLDVIGLEKGSFKIPVIVKEFFKSSYLSNFISLTALALELFQGQPNYEHFNSSKMGDSKGINIELNLNVFYENKQVMKSLRNISRQTYESDRIDSLTLAKLKHSGEREEVKIEKEQLSKFISEEEEDTSKVETCTQNRIELTVISPVLENKMENWKFKLGEKAINAKMMDEDFLNSLDNIDNNNLIVFRMNDTMVVDLVTEIDRSDEKHPRKRYFVIKVYSHPTI